MKPIDRVMSIQLQSAHPLPDIARLLALEKYDSGTDEDEDGPYEYLIGEHKGEKFEFSRSLQEEYRENVVVFSQNDPQIFSNEAAKFLLEAIAKTSIKILAHQNFSDVFADPRAGEPPEPPKPGQDEP